MAANRKLLTEIQQCLKKVDEGVEVFNEIWDKVYSADNQTLKEKFEAELKKEIKKLQRLRDQIKAWIGSSEIKDKNQLVEARKVIEGKMEQFKICERDTKTKAYSKAGLARDAALDPKEAMREEKRNWLNECLERLFDLNNTVEAEKEKLNNGKSKSKNKEAMEKLDNRIQKHNWHIAKIELIIKLIENEELDPSLLDGIKDSLEYYLETAMDDDGALGVEHEFDIYEDLELDSYNINPTFDISPRAHGSSQDEGTPEAPVLEVVHTEKPAETKPTTTVVKETAPKAPAPAPTATINQAPTTTAAKIVAGIKPTPPTTTVNATLANDKNHSDNSGPPPPPGIPVAKPVSLASSTFRRDCLLTFKLGYDSWSQRTNNETDISR